MMLFLLLFLTGLFPIYVSILRTVPHKYELIITQKTWPIARRYCRVLYTDLATILSDTDWLRLQKKISSKGVVAPVWSGLYKDIYSWRWTLNNIPLKNVPYTNWYPGDPDNSVGEELCGIIAANNQWRDAPCTLVRPFICYDANSSGDAKFVRINSPELTWPEAQAYCQKYYTELANSLNSSDDSILVQIKIAQGDSWIGLYRDVDTWKWSDGTEASNIPWAPGQPDNYQYSENCAVIYNREFYDEQCSNLHYFVCHTISPMRSQIMRLQVKSDRSVFDPSVQSSILDQIKQKLRENGMLENSTVTWKVQPDGNIFHWKKDDQNCKINPFKCNL